MVWNVDQQASSQPLAMTQGMSTPTTQSYNPWEMPNPAPIRPTNPNGDLIDSKPIDPNAKLTQAAPAKAGDAAGNAAPKPNPNAYQPATYEAKQGVAAEMAAKGLEVTPEMLVEERLANIMKSPVGKIARDVAMQMMNARGMMDSSAAQNAIVMASIQAGLPIAQQDAATYLAAAQETMDAENAAAEANMNAKNNMTLANMNAVNTARGVNAAAHNRAREFNITQSTQFHQWQQEFNVSRQQWDKTFKEGQRSTNMNYIIAKMQADMQKANSDAERATNKMAFIQSIAQAGLDKASVDRILKSAVAVGLMTQAEKNQVYQQMRDPIVVAA